MRMITVPITTEEQERLPRPSEIKGRYLTWVFRRITNPEYGTWPFGRWLGSEAEGVEYESRDFYKRRYNLKPRLRAEWWVRIVFIADTNKNNSESRS